MLYYLVAALLLLHTVFWGAGISWLFLPRAWRSAWWMFAPVFGFALQSAVVWAGAHTTLGGTNTYVVWSELLPLLLGLGAWGKLGRARVMRRVAVLRRGWPLLAMMAATGLLLLWPMAQRGAWTLTSSSLGSCDHADYAAGARVLSEFARDSDEGFLGLTEVTRVGSAGGFFEFWLKLNHFTPSALIAHNGALLRLSAHQLVSLSGVVALLSTVPLVWLLARAVGLRGWRCLAVAALYAISPLSAYAVHQGALGQLYAAHGIAVLTLATLGCAVCGRTRGEAWRYGVVTLASFWLLAGSYNFILAVALAPAGAWLLGRAWHERSMRDWPRVLGMLGAAFALSVVLFWGRYAGVIERFQLFEQFDFGWPIPRLWPAAWLGLVVDPSLHALASPWLWGVSALVIGGWLAGLIGAVRHRCSVATASGAFVLPVAAGWAILLWESRTRANASYDAFKILSVFLPCLLAGLCVWLGAARGKWGRWLIAVLTVIVVANLWVGVRFAQAMMRPPLRVDRTLVELQRLESMERFRSLNMRIDDFWVRLWANYFLLRKPQYFLTHTYEGRLNTELKGEWDLIDGMIYSIPTHPTDSFQLNEQFHLERVGARGRMKVEFGDGWHAIEGRNAGRWRWSSGPAHLLITNPSATPWRVSMRLRARVLAEGVIRVKLNGVEFARPIAGSDFQDIELGPVVLPVGASRLELATEGPPIRAPGDERMLGVALAQFVVVAHAPLN